MGISTQDQFQKFLYLKQTGVPKERILALARLHGEDCSKVEQWLDGAIDSEEKEEVLYDTSLTDEDDLKQTKERILALARLQGEDCGKVEQYLDRMVDSEEKKSYDTSLTDEDEFKQFLYMKQSGVPKERILILARLQGEDCGKVEQYLDRVADSEEKKSYDTSLTDEYVAAVKRQAEIVHDFRQDEFSGDGDDKEVASLVKDILGCDDDFTAKPGTEPMAFVVRNVLTPTECDELIDAAEDFGIREGQSYVARTAKRTSNYTNAGLSEKVEERIKHILDSKFLHEKEISDSNDSKGGKDQSSPYMGPLYGIHTNWRVLRYDADGGDGFPAHQDQMDSLRMPKKDGSGRKDYCVSSYTLLIQLSEGSLEGGCTRFYPRAKVRLDPSEREQLQGSASFRKQQFDHAVDVLLPRGWALVFKQRGLLHAGQPVLASSRCPKYVAQAGVLRVLPEGVLNRPSVFKNGPGVTKGAF